MPKNTKPPKKNTQKKFTVKLFSSYSHIKKEIFSVIVPHVSGQHGKAFAATVKNLTGAEPVPHTIENTPAGVHIKAGVCGVTASGSKLIYSPSKSFSLTVTSPDGKNKEFIELALLVREKDYTPKQKHGLFSVLELNPQSGESSLSATASPESRDSQESRKRQEKNRALLGIPPKAWFLITLKPAV